MIDKLLSTAVKLYLRSQVTQAEDLQVKIIGKNRQILQGYIPQVLLSCNRAVYQGLYLRQVELKGAEIAFNLSEVLKKKPLKLEPILVDIKLRLDVSDLQASLDSSLLQSGLSDLWQIIWSAQNHASPAELADLEIRWHCITIVDRGLNLAGTYRDGTEIKELDLSTGINLTDSHTLCLSPITTNSKSLSDQIEIDLGTDVVIEQLAVESEQILCSGKIRINN
ncbi:DUF2993 domain-containing protein [Pleurocapsales cyanobacterium LEGE 10410]|nr:DUF2993 domain-containing protein [Pleurocapsales cyanobacterium LEGE 10410]